MIHVIVVQEKNTKNATTRIKEVLIKLIMTLEIFQSLPEFKAKEIILLRHGEFNNPSGIVYNRDKLMRKGEEVHLSTEGKMQMQELGNFIKGKGIKVKMIISSPEFRTLESAQELQKALGLPKIEISDLLDDMYAPGPYLEKMSMIEHEKRGGNVYDKNRWGKYNHETPEHAIGRMRLIFHQTAQRLNISEACILISHGDPIAWFANTINRETAPNPQDLRSQIYPSKGNGILYVIDEESNIINQYMLREIEKKKIY